MAKKKAPSQPAPAAPIFETPVATPTFGIPVVENSPATGKRKRTFNWSETPFAIFKLKSSTPLAACKTKEEAVTELQKLAASQQEKSFLAEFKAVKIETKIVI